MHRLAEVQALWWERAFNGTNRLASLLAAGLSELRGDGGSVESEYTARTLAVTNHVEVVSLGRVLFVRLCSQVGERSTAGLHDALL